MTRILTSTLVLMIASSLLLLAHTAQAASITREQWGFVGRHSTAFDFGPADAGTLTDGVVNVAATLDNTFSFDTFVPASAVETITGGGIRLDFLPPRLPQPGRVTAVVMDFFTFGLPATLQVYSYPNFLQETFTVGSGPTIGFIGANEGVGPIDHVVIKVAPDFTGIPMRIDNVGYVVLLVDPEPATLTLTALGLAGIAIRYRRRPQ